MSENTAIDILSRFARENDLLYESNQSHDRFLLPANDPMMNTQYVILHKDDFIFYAFDSYAAKAYSSRNFFGIYTAAGSPEGFECKISKKDKLDVLLTIHKRKTGNKLVDEALTITSPSPTLPSNLISEKDVAIFLKIWEKINPLSLLVQNNYMPALKELQGKKVIGLETNQWLLKDEELKLLLEDGALLLHHMKAFIEHQPLM